MAIEYLDKSGLTLLISKIKTALGGKVDVVSGKGLSSNDYTNAEKTKLSGIASGASIKYEKVNSLPAVGSNGVIYLIAHSHGAQDIYDEYIWLAESKTFEKIGNTDIDLSGYVKSSELTAISTSDLSTMWG